LGALPPARSTGSAPGQGAEAENFLVFTLQK